MARALSDRVVIVTGASGALGSRLARGLADAGARVVATGREAARLDEVGAARTVAGDLCDEALHEQVVKTAVDDLGRLDGIVNAAGVVGFGPLQDASVEAIRQLFEVNAIAPLLLVRRCLPHLDGGFVANVSAVVADLPTAGMAAYSASKAALTAADAALAREVRRRDIRVLDVRPPHTETGLAQRPIEGKAPRLPQGLEPDDVVRTILEAIVDDRRDLPADAFGG